MPTDVAEKLAFVPQYHYDVFLSYAHGDEASPPKWVSRFAKVLETELWARLGRSPAIWLDIERLKAGFQLDPKIRYDLSRTAVLLRLASPCYYNSGYCGLELEWFEKADDPLDTLVIEGQSRSLFCVLRPDPAVAPPSDTKYIALHDNSGTPLDPDDKAFLPLVSALAADIEGLLRRMAASRKAVFMPYAGPDVEPARMRVMAELHAQGFRTVPRSNEQFSVAGTVEDVDPSPLAVFLLGRTFIADVEPRFEIASEQKKSIVIWLDPDAADMEPEQLDFADRLIEGRPVDVLRRQSVQAFIKTVRTRLSGGLQVALPQRVEAAMESGGPAQKIYLICKPDDRQAADSLRAQVERAGFTVLLSDVQPSAARVNQQRVDELARFKQASGVLLFAKSRAPAWFDYQLGKLMQPSIGTRLADAVALVDPPPKDDMLQSARERGFRGDQPARLLVTAKDQIALDQLDPFLRRLRAGAPAGSPS